MTVNCKGCLNFVNVQMNRKKQKKGGFTVRECLTGRVVNCDSGLNFTPAADQAAENAGRLPYVGRGLVDLQINGVNGIDFNSDTLNGEELLAAARYLLKRGVTTFYPTVITNSPGNILRILAAIDRACLAYPLAGSCVGGIHLEGPFISASDGYRGAHDRRYIMEADWELFCRFQKASGNRIRILTLSPERDDTNEFIRRCRKSGLVVSIAHSPAGGPQVEAAVRAGASLASHLGNSVPLMLPRHPNIIWELLAQDKLYASIVADGFHLPDSLIRVVLGIKKKKALLVSDATCFAGMPPGIYDAHIGGKVLLEKNGRLSMKGSDGLLAGAAKILPENVQYLVDRKLSSIAEAWYMASEGPRRLAGLNRGAAGQDSLRDLVLFDVKDGRIVVKEVFKHGIPVINTK